MSALPLGYIDGLITSNASVDADHDITIGKGVCRDDADSVDMLLRETLTKQIDADWAEGDDAGGFPSGLTLAADTWYHVFVISNGERTDGGFDTSSSATNLLSDATGYTAYRRVGSVLTDGSSNITAFLQQGEYFLWDLAVAADASASVTTTAASYTLSVPPLVTRALMNVEVNKTSSPTTARVCVYSPDQDDQTNVFQELELSGASATELGLQSYLAVHTNSSGQVRAKTDSTGSGTDMDINTRGWIDGRGQN